jgi:hypothetical protein
MEFGLGLIDIILIPLVFIGLPVGGVFLTLMAYRRIFHPTRLSSCGYQPEYLRPVDAESRAYTEELERQLVRAEERADFVEALLDRRNNSPANPECQRLNEMSHFRRR